MVANKTVADATNQVKQGPLTTARKWKAEVHRGIRQQKKWVDEADGIMKIYRSDKEGATAPPLFNILAANTDTIRPAVYNSTPIADIRRRFRKADPVGKAISEILQNVIGYENDTLKFDETMQMVVLDTLLPGRGVVVVEYEPVITQELDDLGEPVPLLEVDEDTDQDRGEGFEPKQQEDEFGEGLFMEQVTKESTPIRHVQYADFIHGTGQQWTDIDWIAIRYRMTKSELKDMFPETFEKVTNFNDIDEELKSGDRDMNRKLRTAEVWKIWDKPSREVIFINDSSKVPLKIEIDPLGLEDFFPVPEPLMFRKDQTSMNPIPPYRLYKAQAEELNRVVARRNAIIGALRIRGFYDASLGDEIPKMMNSGNLELVPIRNRQAIEAAGGLSAAIWIMPLADLASTLNHLYEAEQRIKNTINEITGIADILRGANSPGSQTATEQRIKTQFASLRIQDLQRDIQRLSRDIFRIKAEIIAEHYQPETMLQISGVELDPELGQVVFQAMKDDKLRGYKIDIETDSTIQESIDRDLSGMAEVLGGISELFNSLSPIVQAGAMKPEALQQLALGFIRKARIGREVEEFFSQEPPVQQQEDPEALQQAEQFKDDAQQVLEAATRINEQNQQQAIDIQATTEAHEKLVLQSQTFADTTIMLNQVINDLQNSKAVDSQAIRALREVQNVASATQIALAEQMKNLETIIATPKIITMNRDDSGKILGAVAQVAPPINGV